MKVTVNIVEINKMAATLGLLFSLLSVSPLYDGAWTLERQAFQSHAHELLGAKRKIASKVDSRDHLHGFVYAQVSRSLGAAWQEQAPAVAQAIFEESRKYRFDPLFLMAVIQTESSFRPLVRGSAGEIGLMQIKPSTAQWIAKKMALPIPTVEDLYDPVTNIRIGAAYFSRLRKKFSRHGHYYMAAYNMGAAKVRRLASEQTTPSRYPSRILRNYTKLHSKLRIYVPTELDFPKRQFALLSMN